MIAALLMTMAAVPDAPAVPPPVPPHNEPGLPPGEENPVLEEVARVGETVTVTLLTIGADGRVTGCRIAEPSASPALDVEACRLMTANARFTPPRPGSSNEARRRIRWRVE